MRRVRVAVVDVGANTLRLLVAEPDRRGLVVVLEERRRTGLGADVERLGRLTPEKIARSAEAARKEVRRARKLGAGRIEVVVTSPWRNAENGEELVDALVDSTAVHVRPLTGEEEAELAFIGAVAATPVDVPPIAVCDVGGGSTQLAVGTRFAPGWVRSVPLGSLRLTERYVHCDPPRSDELAAARDEASQMFRPLTPPMPATALATGGTARALRRFGLEELDARRLEAAVDELAALRLAARAKRARADLERARTLPAGAIILAAVQRLLRVPLTVASGGVREGACTQLLETEAATA
jgi:exopolyphosphatase/guanosine-5'-triphosphate,3'-diphosphate pyrophosphatase